MQPNLKFKKFREDKSLTQLELAKKLDISRSLIADIERGSTGISKRVMSKIVNKFNIESGYFDEPKKDKDVESNQGGELGSKQGELRKKMPYLTKFNTFLKDTYPELDQIGHDLITVFSMIEILEALHESKIGNIIFFGVENLKEVTSFNELKSIGLQAYTDVLPYKKILQDYAKASRIFISELNKIKDEIGLDFDFEDYLE